MLIIHHGYPASEYGKTKGDQHAPSCRSLPIICVFSLSSFSSVDDRVLSLPTSLSRVSALAARSLNSDKAAAALLSWFSSSAVACRSSPSLPRAR